MTKGKRTALLVAAIFVTPIVLWVAAYNVPVSMLLGPCLKDWTSPSSYQVRASKLATRDILVQDHTVRICYGRPSARDRVVFGGLVPYGRLWRTGANEPTRLFTPVALRMGGVDLPAGRYSLYTIPAETEWEVFLSTSTFHWGNAIGDGVRAREVGSFRVPVGALVTPVETLTVRGEPSANGTDLIFEWETTQVRIPVRVVQP